MHLPRHWVWRQFVPLVLLTVLLLVIIWSTRDEFSAKTEQKQSRVHYLAAWEKRMLNTRRLAQMPHLPNDETQAEDYQLVDHLNHEKNRDAFTFKVVNGSLRMEAEVAEIRALNATRMLQQAQVRRRMQKVCKERKPFSSLSKWEREYVLRHLIVDDKYQLLYCYVPKVGCANWKRVFNTLYGDVSNSDDIIKVDHKSMHFLSTYTEREIEYRLQNYFKFMFVRHPLDRLLSAYRNKFGEHFAMFEKRYGVYIVQNFRPNPPKSPKGDDVTFAEFLDYVASTKSEKLNEHWSPYLDLCEPCHVSYDFVGYYEDFDGDVNFILEALKLDDIVHYPKKQAYYKSLSKEEKLKFVHEVPNSTLKKLTKRLATDYKLFAYPVDSIDGPDFN